jgi:hypothetical protein
MFGKLASSATDFTLQPLISLCLSILDTGGGYIKLGLAVKAGRQNSPDL